MSALTVGEAAAQNGCSTTVVAGLSQQIVDVVNCLSPGILTKIPDRPNFKPGAATFPYLEKPAADALVKALDAKPGMTLTVNSMLRNVASQYLLWGWAQKGLCGITAAATPGKSNHETGLALDTSDYSAWQTTLEANGFQWFGSGDLPHFDYVGPGAVDLRPTEVKAFQMLWNHNNPGDKISEDGVWGPMTQARVEMSPTTGFPSVPSCMMGTGGSGSGGSGTAGKSGSGTAGTGTAGTGASGTSGSGTAGTGTAGTGASGSSPGQGGTGAAGDPGMSGAAGTSGSGTSAGSTGASGSAPSTGGSTGTAGAQGELTITAEEDQSKGGCGCVVVGSRAPAGAALLAFGAALVVSRRRRR